MPAKKYVVAPIEAYTFNAKNTSELEKLGFTVDKNAGDQYFITGPTGNQRDIADGDYIVVEPDGGFRTASKEWFESHYVETK